MVAKRYLLRRTFIVFFLILYGLASCTDSGEFVEILPGSYQLEEYLPILELKHVGLVVNHTSFIENIHLIDTLAKLQIKIAKVYSPEHGFSGNYDAGAVFEEDSSSIQSKYELVSLYGNKRKPSSDDLQGIEIMVFDLQDVGVRFYTYISTLHYVMEACAEFKIPLIVLDRPNPNGHYVDGPLMESENSSFVGMHPVPIVYGMSIGEYATMINGEYWLKDSLQCELQVIKCDNYSHTSRYMLPKAPSPNLPDMASVYLYPSTCLLEGTVVSEGRGTEAPFQIVGHPAYSDTSFSFTPRSIQGASINPKLLDKQCFGLDLRGMSIDSLKEMESINLEYLLKFYCDLNMGADFFIDYIDLLAGTKQFRKQVLDGFSAGQIQASWQEELQAFKKIRVKYLLYPDFNE